MVIRKRGIKWFLVSLVVVSALVIILDRIFSPGPATFGVTFSPRYAKYLKLDWQKTYLQILDELKVKNLRIPTYWNSTEIEKDQFDYSWLDFILEEANKRGARVILVLGVRQPRWPECHIPEWARKLTVDERKRRLLDFIIKTVERYNNNPAIWAWQVENEPLLPFGEGCDSPDKDFLKEEIKLVKNLSSKLIIVTDSGELGWWRTSMQLSDVFGTTLYRQVYSNPLGYVTYPLPPAFYSLKSNLIRQIYAPQNQKTLVVELQTEPWLADGVFATPEEQAKNFTLKNFKDYVNFAQKTGFSEVYLWGVEWWYFMRENGHPEYLEYAKTFFK